MTKIRRAHIHSTAEVSPKAVVGRGTSVWHQAQIREGAKVGTNCIVGKGVYIDFDVTIGDNCKLQNGVYVYHPAALEDGVFLGPGVIVTNDKKPRAITPDGQLKSADDWRAEAVYVGRGAAIGAGSVILPGVRIGRWAMVGAGSLVTKNVPDHGLAFGNPARLHGYVCACGQQISNDLAKAYICPECGRQYQFEEAYLDPNS